MVSKHGIGWMKSEWVVDGLSVVSFCSQSFVFQCEVVLSLPPASENLQGGRSVIRTHGLIPICSQSFGLQCKVFLSYL